MDEHLARVLLAAGGCLDVDTVHRRMEARTHGFIPQWQLLDSIRRMTELEELYQTQDNLLVLRPAAYETWND